MREISALLFFILFQVCDGQPRKFNIPNKIEALLGSCVEIPCYTMEPPDGVNNRKVVWHVKPAPLGKRIIYSTDESQISPDYKNRAELVRPTINNCTLRIHTVKRKDVRTYYPEEEKRSFFVSVSDNVQLEVADRPSEPILSVPREIPVGESITITCMANYTCASSPPTFSWNVVGPYVTERSDLGNGTWAATSKLTYAPSEAENGSIIQCTVTYFGGQTISTTDRINIKGLDQKSNPYIGAIIGVICVILLLPLVFIIWRKRDSCDWRKKSELKNSRGLDPMKNTASKNSSRYTDLIERQKSSYYTIEPTAHYHVPRQERNVMTAPENNHIYEDMSIRRPYANV